MRAVAELVRLYFMATPLVRGTAALGLVCSAAGMLGFLFVPAWTLEALARDEPIWLQSVLLTLPWLGFMLVFFSTASLPLMVERLARGRSIRVLPGGRVRLLASTVITAGVIALIAAVTAKLSFRGFPTPFIPEDVFVRTLVIAFVDFGLMYVALWLVGKTRGLWLLMGSVLIILGIFLPLAYITLPSGYPPVIWIGALGWAAFAAILLGGDRLGDVLRRVGALIRAHMSRLAPSTAYRIGAEADLLLGTMRPWVVALGQVVPIAVASVFIRENGVWLYYLVLFSAISGAATSHAAARSRRLWLRFDLTRAALFRHVEAVYWRFNAYSLAVLLLLFVGVGTYLDFSTRLLALGLPLLALGAAVSTYLGLMMTRGMGWLETALAIGTTGLLMWAALAAADDAGVARAIQLEAAIAALAAAFRVAAKLRWKALDWMVCRGGVEARGAG